MKVMKRIIFFCLFFQTAALAHATSSDWQLWIVPASRTIDVGDSLKFVYGVTGGGYLNPHDLVIGRDLSWMDGFPAVHEPKAEYVARTIKKKRCNTYKASGVNRGK
jgi:hypothetical protein